MNFLTGVISLLDIDEVLGRKLKNPIVIRGRHLRILPGSGEFPNQRPTIEAPMSHGTWVFSAWLPDKSVIWSKRNVDHLFRMGLRYPKFVIPGAFRNRPGPDQLTLRRQRATRGQQECACDKCDAPVHLTRSRLRKPAFKDGFSPSITIALGKESSHTGERAPELIRPAPSAKPKLLDQVRDAIRRKHFSIRTEQAYCDWIRRFILFHQKRHPAEMGEEEITQFLSHLAPEGRVAASTQNQSLSALLFLYKEVLRREVGWLDREERAKRPAGCRQFLRGKRRSDCFQS
jgi:hypothetical protein